MKLSRYYSMAFPFFLGILSCFLFKSSLVAQVPTTLTSCRDVTVYLPQVLELPFTPGGKVEDPCDDMRTTYKIQVAPVKMSTNEKIHFSLVTNDTGLQQEHPFYTPDGIHFVNYEEMNFSRDQEGFWTPTFQKNIYDSTSQKLLLTVDDIYAVQDQYGGYLGSLLPPAPYDNLDLYASAQVMLISQNVEGSTNIYFDIFLPTGTVENNCENSMAVVHVEVPIVITKN